MVIKVDGVTVVGRVKMGEVAGLPTAAWYCEPMTGGLIIEDPDGDLDLNSWHYISVDEDDAEDGTRIFTGWITGIRIKRGNEKHATARVWDCDVLELNGLFGLEVLRGGDAKRPAETDVARITWLMTANAMDDTPVADLGRFSTAGPINLSEADFVKSFPMEVATPTAGVAGKNIYAYWSDADSQTGLHYDLTATGPSATIAVSNDMADVDDVTTFYPLLDGELERDPSEEATGILLNYRNGSVYAQNATLIDELSPTEVSPSAFKRDQVIESDRIGAEATAQAYVTRFLGQRDRPKEILRFTVRVPATKVNAIHAGDVLSVRFTHLPNLDPAANRVVTRRNVVQSPGRRDFYDVTLECADYELVAPGGGPPDDFPNAPCRPALIQSVEKFDTAELDPPVWPFTPTEGSLQFIWVVIRGDPGEEMNPDGFTGMGAGWVQDQGEPKQLQCRMFYRWTTAGEDKTIDVTAVLTPNHVYMACGEFSGVSQFDDYTETLDTTDQASDPKFFGAGPLTPLAGRPGLAIGAVMPSLNVNDGAELSENLNPNAALLGKSGGDASQNPISIASYMTGPAAVGTPIAFSWVDSPAEGISRGSAGLMALFSGDPCSDTCPATGQWSDWLFLADGDGTTTDFTTPCPYADRTLEVRVDMVDVVIGLTEVDGATGDFSLDFAPKAAEGDAPAEQVYVRFQGR